MIVAHMATYPARAHALAEQLRQLARQVDRIELCLNEYDSIPLEISEIKGVNAFIPATDLKDVGKFVVSPASEDMVFFVDDDIVYPDDYVKTMLNWYSIFEGLPVALGVHGVTYSDFYDGSPSARTVMSYRMGLEHASVVNQLGTGTTMMRGRDVPPLAAMAGSTRFVDVRFARLAYDAGLSLVCIGRPQGWLTDHDVFRGNTDTIFHSFTTSPSLDCVTAIKKIAGFSQLNGDVALEVVRRTSQAAPNEGLSLLSR